MAKAKILKFKNPETGKVISVNSPDGSMPTEADLDQLFALSEKSSPSNSTKSAADAMLQATGLSDIVDPVQRVMSEDARTASGVASGLSLGLARPTINRLTGVDIGEGSLPGRIIGGIATGGGLANLVKQGLSRTALPKFASAGAALFAEGAAQNLGATPEKDFQSYLKNSGGDAVLGGFVNTGLGGIGSGISKIAEKTPQWLKDRAYAQVRELLSPAKKLFSYSKDPVRGIIDEGITGSSLDEIASNIDKASQKIYGEVTDKVGKSNVKINLSEKFLDPIDEQIKRASKAPGTNKGLIERLNTIKDDILGIVRDPDGKIISQRDLSNLSASEVMDLKQTIGDITKFTGNQSDDTIVNGALKNLYGKAKGSLDDAVPGVSNLTERYADLVSAKIAVKNNVGKTEGLKDVISSLGKYAAGIGVGAKTGSFAGPIGSAVGGLAGAGTVAALNSIGKDPKKVIWLARMLNKASKLKVDPSIFSAMRKAASTASGDYLR